MKTEEEIIIDGINVAGCDFYELCGCIDDNHELNECKDNPNCYYKQLQRAKQENNSLEAELQNITVQSNNEITALKQENEKANKDLLTERQENAVLATENYKLRKVLEKIKEFLGYGYIVDKINEVLGNE